MMNVLLSMSVLPLLRVLHSTCPPGFLVEEQTNSQEHHPLSFQKKPLSPRLVVEPVELGEVLR